MADSLCFDLVCELLESESSLDRLEARGTVRLMLKAAGLDSRGVTPDQMRVVIDELLPGELNARGVENGDGIRATLKQKLLTVEAPDTADTPEAVFARLAGG